MYAHTRYYMYTCTLYANHKPASSALFLLIFHQSTFNKHNNIQVQNYKLHQEQTRCITAGSLFKTRSLLAVTNWRDVEEAGALSRLRNK